MGRLRARVPDNADAMDLADELGGDSRSFPDGEARAKNVTFTGVDHNVGSTTTTTINTAEKDDSMGGLNDSSSSSTPATATAAAPRSVQHPHPVDPGSREEVAAFALHEGFATTRHQPSGGRRSKIVASLRANSTANAGGAGATRAGGDQNSPSPPGVMSVHDPTHRRHWQKMKHVALADKDGSAPQTVAARRVADARATRNPPSSSAAAASSSSLRNVLDASPQPPSSDVAATPAGTTAATEAAAAATGGGGAGGGETAVAAASTTSMRSPSFRLRRGGRSSSIGGGGRAEEDSQERAIAIGFQDAELLAWLNSVLFFSVGGAAATTAAGDGLDEFAAKQKQMG